MAHSLALLLQQSVADAAETLLRLARLVALAEEHLMVVEQEGVEPQDKEIRVEMQHLTLQVFQAPAAAVQAHQEKTLQA